MFRQMKTVEILLFQPFAVDNIAGGHGIKAAIPRFDGKLSLVSLKLVRTSEDGIRGLVGWWAKTDEQLGG